LSEQKRSANSGRRKYELKRRAEQQEETRRRIVEAAVGLHQTIGLAATTVSAIAERAGVQRLTVYRHFPDQQSIFAACAQHFFATTPPPDPAGWPAISDPGQRLTAALTQTYAWYERAEAMLTSVTRDAELLPEYVGGAYAALVERLRQQLLAGWPAGEHQRLVTAAAGHALHFRTWRSLVRVQGLTTAEAVTLMARLVEHASAGDGPAPGSGTVQAGWPATH
jgi:AcrR family transcriptional regulator